MKSEMISVRLQPAVVLLLILLSSCRVSNSTYCDGGLKVKNFSIEQPRWSTTTTERGRSVYTDSVTGVRVKVVKYREKNSCFSYQETKHVEILYDSTGKRIGRNNVLRQQRKGLRRNPGGRRRIRTEW